MKANLIVTSIASLLIGLVAQSAIAADPVSAQPEYVIPKPANKPVYQQSALFIVEPTGPEWPLRGTRIYLGKCLESSQPPGLEVLVPEHHDAAVEVYRSEEAQEVYQQCNTSIQVLRPFSISLRVRSVSDEGVVVDLAAKDESPTGAESIQIDRILLKAGETHKYAWHRGELSIRVKSVTLADGSERNF